VRDARVTHCSWNVARGKDLVLTVAAIVVLTFTPAGVADDTAYSHVCRKWRFLLSPKAFAVSWLTRPLMNSLIRQLVTSV
jgi:hypothetical protein